MWETFLENVTIFQNYTGYHQNKFLFGIYLFFLLYLWLTEKDKRFRTLFVYVPTFLLACFFCPLFRRLFIRLLHDEETYYRLLWLLQMSMVSAYGALKLCGKYRKIMLAVMCIAIVSCGSFVYKSVNITKAENLYHIPDTVVEVGRLIEPEEGKRITAVVPAEMIHYIRQYSDRICLAYGREMMISRWDYFQSDLYDMMEGADVLDTPSFVELTRSNYCMYIVLRKDRQLREPLTDYGFELYAETDYYSVYLDTIWK